MGSASTGDPRELSGFIWTDDGLCSTGAGSRFPGNPPALVWRVTGRLVGQDADAYVIDVEWQRLTKQGQPEGAPASKRLTLRLDESQPLERLTPVDSSPCGTAETQLRAAIRLPLVVPPSGGGRGGGGIAVPVVVREAELWLVHTLPNGDQDSNKLTLRVTSMADYAFAPLIVRTAGGERRIDVTGDIRLVGPNVPAGQLRMSIARRLTVNGRGFMEGFTSKLIPIPDPSDVVSFEVPAKGIMDLEGHQFSVRLRVKPSR
jgi:hypothetical protein